MEVKYVKVAGSADNLYEVVGIPVDPDGSISFSSLTSQFDGAIGLKFNREHIGWCGVPVVNGKLKPFDSWEESIVYVATYPKAQTAAPTATLASSGPSTAQHTETKKIASIYCKDQLLHEIPLDQDGGISKNAIQKLDPDISGIHLLSAKMNDRYIMGIRLKPIFESSWEEVKPIEEVYMLKPNEIYKFSYFYELDNNNTHNNTIKHNIANIKYFFFGKPSDLHFKQM